MLHVWILLGHHAFYLQVTPESRWKVLQVDKAFRVACSSENQHKNETTQAGLENSVTHPQRSRVVDNVAAKEQAASHDYSHQADRYTVRARTIHRHRLREPAARFGNPESTKKTVKYRSKYNDTWNCGRTVTREGDWSNMASHRVVNRAPANSR